MSYRRVYESTWSSLIVWTQEIISSLDPELSPYGLQLIDWESHGTTPELPNTDLMGPMSVALSELDAGIFQAVFAIGVSTQEGDENLFRLRAYTGAVFDRMTAHRQIPFYDLNTEIANSYFVVTPGTTVAPLDEIQVRPFQYVQGTALLAPGRQVEELWQSRSG